MTKRFLNTVHNTNNTMKKLLLIVSAVFSACAFGKVHEFDWATVDCPESVSGPFTMKVTLKGTVPEGVELSANLHAMNAKKYGGFLAWHPSRPAKSGKTVTFNFKPKAKAGMTSIDAVVFLAPKGDFKQQVKNVHVGIPWGAAADGKGGSAAAAPAARPALSYPEGVTFKKSSLWIDGDAPVAQYPGDVVTVKVRYHLDPSETWGKGKTKISITPLGPWIDNPDGVVNKKKGHMHIPGLGPTTKAIDPGDGEVEFSWTYGGARRASCFFLVKFIAPDGTPWPWDWRGGSVHFKPYSKHFYVESDAEFGMYEYGKTPSFTIHWGDNVAAGTTSATATVRDVFGDVVAEKTFDVKPAARGTTSFDLPGFDKRGTFAVTVKAGDNPEDSCAFATYPKFKRRPGVPTPFGATDISSPEVSRLAADLGFSYVRHFTGWRGLQPLPDVWRLDGLDRTIRANTDAGLMPWISLQGAPTWALPKGMHNFGFEPAPLDTNAWAKAVTKISQRLKGKLWGWEWLNEIVPGNKCEDPVATYIGICKAGTEAARAVDPNLKMQLAGGLWPQNFRADLLNSGVAKYIDFLPVHYSDFAGITTAKDDLSKRNITNVQVADNETATGLTIWGMDAPTAINRSLNQCLHVLTRWPDELCAGTAFITYFGGSPAHTGNWTYLVDGHTPRPVAVTLAVLQGKLAYAKPLGKFYIDGDTTVHLFEDDAGKAIAVVRAPGADASISYGSSGKATGYKRDQSKRGRLVKFPAKGKISVTDFQGNVTTSADGTFYVGDMPVIVEGADLATLAMHTVLLPGASAVPVPLPSSAVMAGDKSLPVPLRLFNPYHAKKTFTVSCGALDWASSKTMKVVLAPGERRVEEFSLQPTGKAPASADIAFTVASDGVASVVQPCRLTIIDLSSIGNLVKNGDFESGRDGWNIGKNAIVDAPDGTGKALLFVGSGPKQYKTATQTIEIPVPGQNYLYTCWMRGFGQESGSNIYEGFSDGTKTKAYFMPQVFAMGSKGSDGWRLMVKRFVSHANTKALTLTPVADGTGKTYIDNVSLSIDRGTDFAAFAGRKGGEAPSSPVPLCCDNQIQASGDYKWSIANLSGVARFTWDESALHLRCEVVDDASSPKQILSANGEEALKGDVLALAIFPKIGPDGTPEDAQMRWYMSLASPGGGSGKTTLFRPAKYSMGLKSGQLAKDSSVYQVSFAREGGKTVYDVVIPWAEIPGFSPAKGAIFGCNLVLFDADGGAGTGKMVWGADLGDTASGCGIVTLLP